MILYSIPVSILQHAHRPHHTSDCLYLGAGPKPLLFSFHSLGVTTAELHAAAYNKSKKKPQPVGSR